MISEELTALLATQTGLVTRAQLTEHGVSRARLRWALDHRGWRFVLPSVIATDGHQLDARRRVLAAQLYVGPHGVVSSLTAAELHGVTAARDPRVHLTVPVGRYARNAAFVTVRRTRNPDPAPWSRHLLTIGSPARAVVDAARDAPAARQARAIVIEAVQRRIVTAPMLRHELEAGPRPGSTKVRTALADAEAEAWSVPEADLLALTERSTVLPPMRLNPTLVTVDGHRLPTPDGWYDDVALAIQVHSWQYHTSMPDWNATVMSDSAFAEHGIAVVPLTPNAIRTMPEQVLRRIETAYRQAQRRPRPAVIAKSIAL